MSVHQYKNNPSTTLSGGVTSGDAAISVASGSLFPTQGKFTIIVDSEIMLVTGVSGTTWTVERGHDDTTAAAHNNNATVTQILTVDSFLNAHRFDVRFYGAKGDGATDDTNAIQAALTAAGTTSGVVFLPPTDSGYLCDGQLTVPAGVTLEGAYHAPAGNFQRVGAPVNPPGSQLRTTANAGSTDASLAFITLGRGSTLKGVSVYYPDQTNTDPPVAYPPTVTMEAPEANAAIINCMFENPYIGVWCVDHSRILIDGLYGWPLHLGIHMDEVTDVARLNNIHFWPFWTQASEPVGEYVHANATAFRFGRVDELYGMNLFAYGYKIGFEMVAGDDSGLGGWGSLTNIGADACHRGIDLVMAQTWGWRVQGGLFIVDGATGVGSPCGVRFGGDSTAGAAKLLLDNCVFGGSTAGNNIRLESGSYGTLMVSNTLFQTWDGSATGANGGGSILTDSGNAELMLTGCRWTPTTSYQLNTRFLTAANVNVRAINVSRYVGGKRFFENASPAPVDESGNF